MNFCYISSNFAHFLPHFGSPGGRVAHLGRPWLRYWLLMNLNEERQNMVNFVSSQSTPDQTEWSIHLVYSQFHNTDHLNDRKCRDPRTIKQTDIENECDVNAYFMSGKVEMH